MPPESSRRYALEIAEALRPLGQVALKRFFGGSGLHLGGVQFAFVIEGTLFLRVDEPTRPQFVGRGAQPFSYAGRSGPVKVMAYFAVPPDILEDVPELQAWARQALSAALRARAGPGRQRP